MRRVITGTCLILALAACSSQTPATDKASAAPDTTSDETVTVTGIDYAFEGIPENATVGTELAFVNEGSEPHELIVMRRSEGTDQPLEELLQLPEEEAMQLVSEAGAIFAMPGETAEGTIALNEPGQYIALCFVPVGTSPEDVEAGPSASGEHGPPHFVEGMVAEFTVTE